METTTTERRTDGERAVAATEHRRGFAAGLCAAIAWRAGFDLWAQVAGRPPVWSPAWEMVAIIAVATTVWAVYRRPRG